MSICRARSRNTSNALKSSRGMGKHCVPKNVHLFIFQITLSQIDRFQWFLVCEILRKFDISSIYTCSPHVYTVTTLPWEIKKSFFNSIVHTDFRLLCYLRRNKLQLLYYSLSVYLLCLLLPIIKVALFYSYFLSVWSVIFKAINANPQPALFRATNI